MKFSTYKKLLEKYHQGKSSRAERQLVDWWYDSFEHSAPTVKGLDTEDERQVLKNRLLTRVLPNNEKKILPGKFYHTPAFTRAAAVIMLFGAGILLTLYFFWPNAHKNLPKNQGIQRFTTAPGERKKLRLPDGSSLTLNANSCITILSSYGKGQRTVELNGEAFFDIKPQSANPFKVRTKHMIIQVLGTSFNVKDYAAQNAINIAVTTGRIRVKEKTNNHSLLLTANESCSYDQIEWRFKLRSGAHDKDWISGNIVLEHVTFNDLTSTFQNMYGMRLTSKDASVLQNQYTLTMKYSRTATETVETICHILNKQYRKEANGNLTIF